jgi:pyrroline-5-carboxylate reductase
MIHIVLVGCGKMGSALLSGWLKQGILPLQVTVVEPQEYTPIAKEYGVRAVPDYAQVKDDIPRHVVVFAVKPQTLDAVLPAYANQKKIDWYISIAAGKKLEYYTKILGKNCAFIRAMPNLPATLGKGVTGLCANANVTQDQREKTQSLFYTAGEYIWVDNEGQMDIVTAISGSGPAYVFYFIECLREAGESLGLKKAVAHQLALSTVYGSAYLAKQTGVDITDLRKAVTSPKGTTEAALSVLQSKDGLKEMMLQAVSEAHRRAQELAREE